MQSSSLISEAAPVDQLGGGVGVPSGTTPLINSQPARHTACAWVCSYPVFDGVLVIAPVAAQDAHFSVALTVYDPDGFEINRVELETRGDRPTFLEIEPFLERCKLECGIKHAQVVLAALQPFQVRTLLLASEHVVELDEGFSIGAGRSVALPLSFAPHQRNYLSLVNTSSETSVVKVRVMTGRRSGEQLLTLAPRAARLLPLELELSLTAEVGQAAGYARVSHREGSAVVRLLTVSDRDEERLPPLFTGLG